MVAMAEYKKRFEDLDIKDDSGIYLRSLKLYQSIDECIAEIEHATDMKDEGKIIAALERLE